MRLPFADLDARPGEHRWTLAWGGEASPKHNRIVTQNVAPSVRRPT